MENGYKANPNDAAKIASKLYLSPGETVLFVGKCNNWMPVAAEWLVVTNSRVIASPTVGVRAVWEAPNSEVTSALGDVDKKSLTITRTNGETFTFKKVPPEDHASVIRHVTGRQTSHLPPASVPTEPGATAETKKEGGFAAAMKKAAADMKAAAQEQQDRQASAFAEGKEKAGKLAHSGLFGGTTVEVYDGGYVRVGAFLSKVSPFEKLRSVTYRHQVQDKSAGGRAVAGIATGGLSYLASSEKRVLFLTIATDRMVHTLKTTGGMGRADDKAGFGIEAACKGVIAALAAEPSFAAPVEGQQAAGEPSLADQLRQIADLHREGILSDEEFASAKAKLLGVL